MIILDDNMIQELKEHGMPAEQEIVVRHFLYFGPLSEGLLRHVHDETWEGLFKGASGLAEMAVADDPDARFERWSSDVVPHLTPAAQEMMSEMMYLDPGRRATIDEILEDPWW